MKTKKLIEEKIKEAKEDFEDERRGVKMNVKKMKGNYDGIIMYDLILGLKEMYSNLIAIEELEKLKQEIGEE